MPQRETHRRPYSVIVRSVLSVPLDLEVQSLRLEFFWTQVVEWTRTHVQIVVGSHRSIVLPWPPKGFLAVSLPLCILEFLAVLSL